MLMPIDLLGLQRLADFEVVVHSLFIAEPGDFLRIDDVDVLDVGLQAFADSFGQGPGRARIAELLRVSGLQTTATFFPFRPSNSARDVVAFIEQGDGFQAGLATDRHDRKQRQRQHDHGPPK